MITDVQGVLVGHHTDGAAMTGCTVVLLPDGTTGAYRITGAAPATRETHVMDPPGLVSQVHAFVLSGGSAFGLAAADGVMDWLAERRTGFAFGASVVPIVPAACLFDLGVGDGSVRPGPGEGRAAAEQAGPVVTEGRVGAGTGATVAKWAGPEHARPGGIGTASVSDSDLVVGALVACNAAGDVYGADGAALAATKAGPQAHWEVPAGTSTVLAVVATNATFDKAALTHIAAMSDAGLSRSIRPCHTQFDGDIIFAAATGRLNAPPWVVGEMGAEAVAEAVRRSVRPSGVGAS